MKQCPIAAKIAGLIFPERWVKLRPLRLFIIYGGSLGKAKKSPVSGHVGILNFLFFLLWNDVQLLAGLIWNYAVLCFKRLFRMGLWTFSHHRPTLYMGNFFAAYTYFPVDKNKITKKQTNTWPETGDFLGLTMKISVKQTHGDNRPTVMTQPCYKFKGRYSIGNDMSKFTFFESRYTLNNQPVKVSAQ